MRDLILLFVHILATSIRLARPGGVRSVLAESVLLKHQLLILNRSRRRAPNLRVSDRLIAGLCALLVLPRRLVRLAVVVKPSTLLKFHRALVHRKYRPVPTKNSVVVEIVAPGGFRAVIVAGYARRVVFLGCRARVESTDKSLPSTRDPRCDTNSEFSKEQSAGDYG